MSLENYQIYGLIILAILAGITVTLKYLPVMTKYLTSQDPEQGVISSENSPSFVTQWHSSKQSREHFGELSSNDVQFYQDWRRRISDHLMPLDSIPTAQNSKSRDSEKSFPSLEE